MGHDISRRRLVALLGGSLLVGGTRLGHAATSRLSSVRLVRQGRVTLQLDVDGADADAVAAGARVFELGGPDRIVVDLPLTALADGLAPVSYPGGVVSAVRYGTRPDGALRIVVDLRRAVGPSYRFAVRSGGQRLLLDLGAGDDRTLAAAMPAAPEPTALRDVVVVIDAGHGGEDPGATGQRDTHEKDVTLAIARRLYARLAATRGVTPVMVRENDTYVELRDRLGLAREHLADLFVSIHADAFPRREARGSSVYALSLDGASSEAAAWLADSENESAALYGDVSLDGLGAGLRETLLDLAQSSTLEASLDVGAAVLAELGRVGAVHKPTVEQASFAVLKAPDIPSILIETAFISNREEEAKLGDPRYQQALAEAIARGLSSYLARRAPPGTLLHAERRAAN